MTDCVVVKLLFNNRVMYGLAALCTGLCPKFINQSIKENEKVVSIGQDVSEVCNVSTTKHLTSVMML